MTRMNPHRRVVTFYSFKGGVGRTMAVANVAYRLANTHGLRVVVVDWDLEAPGLHRFLGLPPERVAEAPGVLDYLLAWREAKNSNAPHPPDATRWILPITAETHRPRFGELFILTAGRIDPGYETRLAGFHWSKFYEDDAGAAAVETLRAQLLESADVVLIDSRTGFTDPGGICTIQLPDAVVLMTAPNEQSLEGTAHIARAITHAPATARASRETPKIWLAVCRVPFVEESELAQRWFAEHEPWFDQGITDGLWKRDDHPNGLRTFEIPHRSRWSFNEKILTESTSVDSREPLANVYTLLAGTLLRWLHGVDSLNSLLDPSPRKATAADGVEILEAEVLAAEKRADMLGMASSLSLLAQALANAGRRDEAIRCAEQASGIYHSQGALNEHLAMLMRITAFLSEEKRFKEVETTSKRALTLAKGRHSAFRPSFLYSLALSYLMQSLFEESNRAFVDAVASLIHIPDEDLFIFMLEGFKVLLTLEHFRPQVLPALRQVIDIALKLNFPRAEASVLREILALADAGTDIPDAAALRTRLADLLPPAVENAG